MDDKIKDLFRDLERYIEEYWIAPDEDLSAEREAECLEEEDFGGITFEEVGNRTFSLEEMKAGYSGWIREVKEAYFKLSDADPAPAERIRWAEAILDLAGWVTDMALFLEKKNTSDDPGEQWMVKHAVGRYRQALDQLCRIQQ